MQTHTHIYTEQTSHTPREGHHNSRKGYLKNFINVINLNLCTDIINYKENRKKELKF